MPISVPVMLQKYYHDCTAVWEQEGLHTRWYSWRYAGGSPGFHPKGLGGLYGVLRKGRKLSACVLSCSQ